LRVALIMLTNRLYVPVSREQKRVIKERNPPFTEVVLSEPNQL